MEARGKSRPFRKRSHHGGKAGTRSYCNTKNGVGFGEKEKKDGGRPQTSFLNRLPRIIKGE